LLVRERWQQCATISAVNLNSIVIVVRFQFVKPRASLRIYPSARATFLSVPLDLL
jgi:hypothetical protein